MTDARVALLTVALHHVVSEPNIAAGYERVAAIAGGVFDYNGFSDADAGGLRDELVREPICLPESALECHWHLELTPGSLLNGRKLLSELNRRSAPRHTVNGQV